jgi:kinetochore protein Spc7/SPC105
MDLTSIQRRVSFADKSQVRLFDRDHTNSTGSPPSSPAQDPEPELDQAPPVINDENAYPGANKSRTRRRSSLRRSFGTDIGAGEESMELDTTRVITMTDELKLTDESWDGSDHEEGYDEDDMDMTEIVRRQSVALRRRSSMHRRSLAPPEEPDQDKSVSEVGESEDSPPHTDFTVPLGQPLRKPEPPPEEWHALRAVTHAGVNDSVSEDGDTEPNELELGDAISRLMVARDSLGIIGDGLAGGDHSFASTESDSFTQDPADFANADKTMDITGMLRRASSGTFSVPSGETTSEYGSSRTHDTDERINLPIALPQENQSPSIYPDISKLTPSVSTKPPPIFQKPTTTQPVFKPPTTETPKATPLNPGSVFKPRPLERQSVFSLQNPSVTSNAPSMASTVTTDAQPQKRPITETEKPVEERPTPGKRQATSHLTAPSTSRASSAPPVDFPSKGARPTPNSPGKKAGLTSSPRKPGFPARGRTSSVSGLRRTSASFTHGQKPSATGPTTFAFGTRVPAPVRGRKSAPGATPSPSKKPISLPPEVAEPIPRHPISTALQEPQDEDDMEIEQDDEVPEASQLPPSKFPSPPPRAESPVTPPEKGIQKPRGERPEIEITPPEDDDPTSRWRDEVTTASDPESPEEVGSRYNAIPGLTLTRGRSTSQSNNFLP